MKQTLFLIAAFFVIINFTNAQSATSLSSSGKLNPAAIEKVQNQSVQFSMVMTPMTDHAADFLVFANATSNGLFVQHASDIFTINIINADGEPIIKKETTEGLLFLDASVLLEDTYTVRLQTADKEEAYKLVLRSF